MSYQKIKRILDVFFALMLLVLFIPIFIIIPITIRIEDSSSPAIFKQKRIGEHEKIFTVYKFRSMRSVQGDDVRKPNLPDIDRMLKVGKFIRKTSLDELPQLINIIKGDMSFIGPRPLFMEYLPYYTDQEKKRHNVKPGISGWAQVNGRNAISWDEKLSMDVYYVNNISIILDTKIFIYTIKKVLLASDVIHDEGEQNTLTLVEYRSK